MLEKKMIGRGMLTEEIQAKAKEILGIEFTQKQLRLMPYIQARMIDGQNIEPTRITPDERRILMEWKEKGFIRDPASDLDVTKQFWDAMNEIIWLGYVRYDNEYILQKR